MTAQELITQLQKNFTGLEVAGDNFPIKVTVNNQVFMSFMQYVRKNLELDYLMFNSAVDRIADNKIEALYMLGAQNKAILLIKVLLYRENPEIESVSSIYHTAEWHEREASELFGIKFLNHPDPRKLLLTDDFQGYPLRKDFKDDFMLSLPDAKGKE